MAVRWGLMLGSAAMAVGVLVIVASRPVASLDARSHSSPTTAVDPTSPIPPATDPRSAPAALSTQTASSAPASQPVTKARSVMADQLKRREQWWRAEIENPDGDPRKLVDAARNDDDEAQVVLSDRLAGCEDERKEQENPKATQSPDVGEPKVASTSCQLLSEHLQDGERSAALWRDRAATAGNAPALFMQSMDSEFGNSALRAAALRHAFAARDPALLSQLSGQATLDPEFRSRFYANAVTAKVTTVGNLLGQCALGLDCSKDGLSYQSLCSRGGPGCDRATDLSGLFELRLKAAEFQQARDHASRVVRDLDGPIEDSPEAAAVLRQITAVPK